VNFQDADIRDVLRLISTYANVNIVADPEVTAEITISLKDVPWDKALTMILQMYGLDSVREGNIIRVTTAATMKKLKEETKTEELKTESFFLNFASASKVKESIAGVISKRGKITVNERANALIITDIPTRLSNIEKIIKGLDIETPQVTIETRIMQIDLGKDKDLGIDWNIVGGITKGAIRPTTFPFETNKKLGNYGAAFPTPADTDFTFGVLSADTFRAVLHMLETRTDTQTLSAPNITTLSNKEAKIITGTEYPVPTMTLNDQTGTWQVTGYEFIKVGIILTVTPTIRPGGEITMKLKPVVSEVVKEISFLGGLTVPVIGTKTAETNVMVKDGETLVIGGLMETTKKETISRVPFLGDIPLLGYVFRRKDKSNVKTDLLIFVTPHIVKEQKLSAYQKARLGQIDSSRRLDENKQMARFHYLSGKRYLQRRDYKQAIREFQQALKLNPTQSETGRLLRRAEGYLKKKGK
jgi:type IV pilus assembly protein PilQ